MKKVLTISFLTCAVLLSGCEVSDSSQGSGQTRPAVSRSGRSYFWDKDLRPTLTVPTRREARPTETQDVEAELASEQEVPAGLYIEPEAPAQTPEPQAKVVTATVEDLKPVKTPVTTPAPSYSPKVAIGPDLVAVDESGANALSMTYPRADYGILQVDKTMPQEVRLNAPFAYVIKVTNLTDMMLTDVSITETLSNEFEFKGSEPTAQNENNKLVWEIDSLGPKASKSIRITGVATGSNPLEHCTAITHTVRDCAMVKVVEPTLELGRVAPAEAVLCEPIPVDYVVTNTGTGAAQNVQIVDTLPVGLQTTDGKGKVILDAGTLIAGESRRFSIKLRATKTGAYVSKAIATSASGLRAESESTLTNVRQPILSITKSGPQRQYLGRAVTYEITVLNKGDGPARDTMVEDLIPPGVSSIEATAGAQTAGSKLVWELGTLEPNASKTVRVSYTPMKEGEVMATATATAYCADTVSDSAKTTITGIPASRLQVIDLEDPVEVSQTTTYLITVVNEGSAADSNVRIVCTLDDKVQYVSSAGATAGSIMGKTVNFAPLRTLEPKAKATWRVVVRGARAGDVRFKVSMHTDQLALPIEHTEATHVYEQ
ncbi:MAG TPA: hypothetical protein PLU87_11680 [Sedimentisphaerales bacterium]|nr:hypothetical protein [Sedimentisphaerales bacterium]HRS11698.1 hypothetical protein [Sedimentisphaerales bacterium]HRV48361.1 hypothetical protein [Sedimentisphaerales bacterium]